MVGATGFEPATLCSQSRCATRLRYAPTDAMVSESATLKASPYVRYFLSVARRAPVRIFQTRLLKLNRSFLEDRFILGGH